MTTHAATHRPVPEERPEGIAALRMRAAEARDRLVPERPAIPAPRTPGGVTPPPSFRSDPHAPAPDLLAAADTLVADLAALEDAEDEPGRDALARIADLTTEGVPDHGWSTEEDVAVDDLVAAAATAAILHASAAALLERLDAEDRGLPAATVDALAGSLRVIRMVADLEVFARSR